MHTHLLRAAALAAALLPGLTAAAPLSLETALDMAVQRSEAARAGRAGLQSAAEAARAAGQLPDPTLNVGVDNLPVTGPDRLNTARDSMTMKRIGFSQEWVSGNKRVARRNAAEALVNRQGVLVKAAVADTRLQTALAYLDAFYAGEALRLTTLMEHHAHEELEAARGRLSSATASSQEVLALTGARGAAEDESAEVRQQQSAAAVQLERWVGSRVDQLSPPDDAPLPTEQDYIGAHPVVIALQRDVDVARQEAAVTATNRSPNWTWGVSYGQRTGYSDMVTFGVSIPIPLSPGERQDRDTAAKLALVDKAEADLAEATRTAAADYRRLLSDAQRLQNRVDRYRGGVVTPAGQRTSVAMAAYASNQVSLVTLFEARHAEVDAQRKLLALRRDLAKAKAQLTYKPLTPGAAQ
ncbi:MAG: TolC family protein [Pseudomonadota bacterium]|nr:TolC family protein [Pseudomonadota bacterium]